MTFDIHLLDDISQELDDTDQILDEYQETLVELFCDSAEGQAHRLTYPDMGFWAGQLINRGFQYVEVSPPEMTAEDVAELLNEIFPRKISLASPEEAADILPELTAFWEYLRREYQLANADEILGYLASIDGADVVREMNNPAKFGMAKSFFTEGQAAGFDMGDQEEMNTFMHLYNLALPTGRPVLADPPVSSAPRRSLVDGKKKDKRKAAKESRRRNRRKKK